MAGNLRAVPPDPAVIAWLWSEEGLLWARKRFLQVQHRAGQFADIKLDHECRYGGAAGCSEYVGAALYPDERILSDLRDYGISGVPQEWKDRSGCWNRKT